MNFFLSHFRTLVIGPQTRYLNSCNSFPRPLLSVLRSFPRPKVHFFSNHLIQNHWTLSPWSTVGAFAWCMPPFSGRWLMAAIQASR
jgi:hypothetical protein